MENAANRITLARIFLAPLFIVIILTKIPNGEFWAALVFVLAASTDGLDIYCRKNKIVVRGSSSIPWPTSLWCQRR